VGWNIRELSEHGTRPRSYRQIVAIALHAAGVSKKSGGLKSMASKGRKK